MIGFHLPLKRKACFGFTLLEVLVALAIFAMVSVMCFRQVDTMFKVSSRVEQRYLALWLAENALEEIFIKREFPIPGESKSTYKFSSAIWGIKTAVSETEIKNFRKIEVSVYADEEYKNPVLSLTRYIGKE